MPNTTSQLYPLQGWMASPDGRGSIDIITSCMFTIFICIWSVLCVNIGAPGDSAFRQFLQKLKLALICILGPDFLLLIVLGQWESARRSCQQFKQTGLDGWSMRHAFYADMGGFMVRTRDGVTWPLNANQLHYLVVEGWIPQPTLSNRILLPKKDIDDRNKQNTLLRVFSVAQIVWFSIGCIARACQRLAITTLELVTIGFIATTICVSIFWLHKPADIETQQIIELEATISEIYIRGGVDETFEWYETPLDFLNSQRAYFAVAYTYWRNVILPKSEPKPIQKRPDDAFLPVSHRGMLVIVAAGLFSWGGNFLAWNFHFPTTIELQLWRASSIVLIGAPFVGAVYQEILLYFFPDMRKKACERFSAGMVPRPKTTSKEKPSEILIRKSKQLAVQLSNNSPNHDPTLTLQLRVLLPALVCSFMYTFARLYLLLEDGLAFRGQNPDVYKTVNWVGFLPHV